VIEILTLENFKAFKYQEIQMRPLTVLAGLNGMGKSSVLQALLLLRQSFQQLALVRAKGSGLVLNGELAQLGTGRDVLFDGAEKDEIGFILKSDGVLARWRFAYDREADVLRQVTEKEIPQTIYASTLFSEYFHYLEAERVGPRTTFEMADFVVRELNQMGTRGQYAAHFLHQFRSRKVQGELHHPNSKSLGLWDQVNAWMGETSPGAMAEVESHPEMDVMQLAFGFERSDTTGNVRRFRSTNVGFGLTYTFPVLVALLSSHSGSLILLENPESHLHPRGQSKVGELIARAALAGIQIIVETHSDHILNGIRIAVKDGVTMPDDIAIHFFERPSDDRESSGSEVVSPQIDSDGRLDIWPEDFFDEYGKSLRRLL